MARLFRGLLSFIVLSAGCWAQSQTQGVGAQPSVAKPKQPAALHLTTVESVTARSEVATGFADLACDGDGNLYLGADSAAVPAIRKLNVKGSLRLFSNPMPTRMFGLWDPGLSL